MFNIELLLKNSNSVLLVQRKSQEEAKALFEQILVAIDANKIQTLKLTCDRQPQKITAVLSSEIAAVQLSE